MFVNFVRKYVQQKMRYVFTGPDIIKMNPINRFPHFELYDKL